jgi:hypothetical protein
MKKRTALLRQLKVVFRSLRSQPIRQVIEIINPILRGWGFSTSLLGHASQCFSFVRNWSRKRFGATWPEPGCAGASAGKRGIDGGFTMYSVCLTITESAGRKTLWPDKPHNS